ncbi:MAG: gliding motility-associated C-terminal domain-containing protein [Ferruginibacter sp.]
MNVRLRSLLISILGLIATQEIHAQLCQGSLGDPIINTTFGAGNNPGAALSAATTNYQYIAADCPNDGSYTVRSNTSGCFGGNWHSLSGDHTGDANGYFMLVNASYSPSAFYLDTVKGLCGGSTYEFAAWVINVIDPSKAPGSIEPNLTFSIEKTDGTVLQTYNTNNIPTSSTPAWRQFGFFFTTPGGISNVVLRIFNNAPGGNGNDLGLDDITFRACGPQLTPSVNGIAGNTGATCEGISKSFNLSFSVSAGFNNPSFQWQQNIAGVWTDIPGANAASLVRNFTATAPPGGNTYRLAVAEAGNLGSLQCRVVSPVITIQVNKIPVTTAVNNGPVCPGNILQLTAAGGAQYSWSGPNNFSAGIAAPVVNNIAANNAGKYYVMVKNAEGCNHLDSTTVVINPAPAAQVSFTAAAICKGDSVKLSVGGGTGYSWQPATGLSASSIANPTAAPLITTSYIVTVTNQFMCTDTAAILVTVLNKPTADAGPDRIIIAGNSIQLQANATGTNIIYTWVNALNINDPYLLRPTVNPKVDAKYILRVASSNGCGSALDTMNVFVYKGLYIPNAFTPNGDNINDTWNIPALGAYPNFELSVFNRYGQLIFRSSGFNKPWDGKFKGMNVTAGAYIYYIDLKTGNGLGKLSGTVMLIR